MRVLPLLLGATASFMISSVYADDQLPPEVNPDSFCANYPPQREMMCCYGDGGPQRLWQRAVSVKDCYRIGSLTPAASPLQSCSDAGGTAWCCVTISHDSEGLVCDPYVYIPNPQPIPQVIPPWTVPDSQASQSNMVNTVAGMAATAADMGVQVWNAVTGLGRVMNGGT